MGKSSTSFKSGQSGNPNGRVKGSKNKRTIEIEEKCREKGFDPIEFLIELALNEKVDMSNRLRAACEINNCLNPKLKAVEHSGLGGNPMDADYDKLSNDELRKNIEESLAQTGQVIKKTGSKESE